jgi:hypothetical protein
VHACARRPNARFGSRCAPEHAHLVGKAAQVIASLPGCDLFLDEVLEVAPGLLAVLCEQEAAGEELDCS